MAAWTKSFISSNQAKSSMEWGGGHGELVPFKVVAPGRSDRLQSMVTHPRKQATLIALYGCLKNNDEELGEYRVGRVDLAGAGGRECMRFSRN